MFIKLEKVKKKHLKTLHSTNLVRQIVCKWRKFKTIVTLPRVGQPTKIIPNARLVIVTKTTTVTSEASLMLANVNFCESNIRRTLNNLGVHGRFAGRKPVLSKKNIAAHLRFTKDHVDKPEDYLKVVDG